MLAKLAREPIEDLRVDVEDGYGHRPDDEEDAAVVAVADSLAGGGAPPRTGACGSRVSSPRPAGAAYAASICSWQLCCGTARRPTASLSRCRR